MTHHCFGSGKVFSGHFSASNAWNVNLNNGNVNNNNKTNSNRVRPCACVPAGASAITETVYDIPFSSVIHAWRDCESNKRRSDSCTKFRWGAPIALVELWNEMRTRTYKPRASMCFMVTYPVLREVWAGAFRDRIAHHWENLRFGPVIERYFVSVGDRSMNCRKGYGSLKAIKLLTKAIYDYTEGYTRDDCWIVGGDFANFFMSIDKEILWQNLLDLMLDEYEGKDKAALLYMMHETLFHRCQDNYFLRSPKEMWENLPPRKSLFHMNGLPIGNLPSQIWANFTGAIFTCWALFVKRVEGFILFVDDWRCLARSADEGKALISEFRQWLWENLHVTLHPDKVYLQHYTKGTKITGAVIKPGRTYIANRTRGHFIETMIAFNRQGTTHAKRVAMLEHVRASINSYLGMMVHHRTYRVRSRICKEYILPTWGKYLYFTDEFTKCKLRKEYDTTYVLRKKLHNRKFAAKFIRPKW